jgi:hypothetical protein
MTQQEIQELAGHRQVPAWVIKLVGDCLAKEREQEPVAWMYDWTSDEGEFIQDWTTSMAETLRDTGKTVITNVRPLYSAPQVIHKPLQHFGEIPMAWCRWSEHFGKWMYTHRQPTEELAWIPLYDHPPQQRKPLTDEMAKQMKERCDSMEMRGAFADGWLSAEAAHGIKGKA